MAWGPARLLAQARRRSGLSWGALLTAASGADPDPSSPTGTSRAGNAAAKVLAIPFVLLIILLVYALVEKS
jgi:hypothetical protein